MNQGTLNLVEAISGQLKAQNLQLLKHTLLDTLHIKWLSTTLNMNGKRIDLPENVNIPKIEVANVKPTTQEEV